jgi:hypothetical protein
MRYRDAGRTIRELPIEGNPHLELRRLEPAGAYWALVAQGGAKRAVLSVTEAAALAGDGWWDVSEATRIELEHWDTTGRWQGSRKRDHPNDDAAVQALFEGWRQLWEQFRARDDARPRARVRAFDLPFVFDWVRDDEDPTVRAAVTGHGAISDHVTTVYAALHEIVEEWERAAIVIIDSPSGYVQVLDRKRYTTVYAEAVDPEGQDAGTLTPDQRDAITALGWSDPKIELVPYERPSYANEWNGRNFALEWPRDGDLRSLATVLVRTLGIYGLEEPDDLDLTMFLAVSDEADDGASSDEAPCPSR